MGKFILALSMFFYLSLGVSAFAESRMSAEQIDDAVKQIAPTKSIISEFSAINQPLIYFIVEEKGGNISDISKEDVFTKIETYSHSVVYCELDVTFFTPISGKRVYVGSDAGETFPQTLAIGLRGASGSQNFNLWVGGFASQNMLETNLDNGYNATIGNTQAATQFKVGEYQSREAAETALGNICDVSKFEQIELFDFGFGSDGILVEGEASRKPFFGYSTWFLVD